MKTPVRRALGAAALVLTLPLAAACGFDAQTDQHYQSADGPDDRSGEVDVLNAIVVADSSDRGVFAGSFANNSADQAVKLVGITGSNINGSQRAVDVPAGGLVNLADGTIPLLISGPVVKPGGYVTLTFDFDNGQTTTMHVPVMAQAGDYAGVTVPTPIPVPAKRTKPSTSASATPTG